MYCSIWDQSLSLLPSLQHLKKRSKRIIQAYLSAPIEKPGVSKINLSKEDVEKIYSSTLREIQNLLKPTINQATRYRTLKQYIEISLTDRSYSIKKQELLTRLSVRLNIFKEVSKETLINKIAEKLSLIPSPRPSNVALLITSIVLNVGVDTVKRILSSH